MGPKNAVKHSSKASRQEYFDRVLCDVPCSGDGTIRKQPSIWTKWSQNNGAALHPLQVKITLRGLTLLKPGGTLVYVKACAGCVRCSTYMS